MISKRGKIIQLFLISIFLFIALFIPIGEGNILVILIEYSYSIFKPYISHFPYGYQIEVISSYLLLIINITLLILFFIKKINRNILKIFAIVQFALYIVISLIYINASWEFSDFYAVAFIAFILMIFSLLQVLNLFCISPKRYKRTSIIVSSIVLIFLSVYSVLFWTVSRFEFELNEDEESYSIVSIESDIPTIKIPSTYQGLPITKINSNYYIYQNIQEIIFEEDSNIEIIEKTAFRCRNLRKIILPSSLQTIGDNAFSFCHKLEEVIIPIEVINIGGWVFDCENGIIYCEAKSKPDTWEVGWCYQAKEIIWGYRG